MTRTIIHPREGRICRQSCWNKKKICNDLSSGTSSFDPHHHPRHPLHFDPLFYTAIYLYGLWFKRQHCHLHFFWFWFIFVSPIFVNSASDLEANQSPLVVDSFLSLGRQTVLFGTGCLNTLLQRGPYSFVVLHIPVYKPETTQLCSIGLQQWKEEYMPLHWDWQLCIFLEF